MPTKVLLTIGTRKGLWLATSTSTGWEVTGPQLPMTDIYSVCIDTRRRPRILVGATSEHFGPSVLTSDDLGMSWQEPKHAPVAFPADTETGLSRVWQLAPGPDNQPDVMYAGTEPAGLFRSEDGGRTYEFVRGLWDHPHRPNWTPGGGGLAVHTVIAHPRDDQRMMVAISAGGAYRTSDGGQSWTASNQGVRVKFMPDPYPEYGHCVHKITRHPARPERFFLQNHHGVYRSDNDGDSWRSIADGLPSDFGFPLVSHPHRPEVIYGFPLVADERRFPPEGKCRVYRSQDAGKSWTSLSDGLPSPFWSTVLRDAMCTDTAEPAGVYFGARNGEVYASRNEGESWELVAAHLPDVLSVRAAVL